MGDLARERSARDLWISRSHLRAAGTGVALAVLGAFAVGLLLGRGTSSSPREESEALLSEVPGNELEQLLARVETAADLHGGVKHITFPDALRDEGEAVSIPLEPEVDVTAVVAGGEAGTLDVDPRPEGSFTVHLASFEDFPDARAARDRLAATGVDGLWVGVVQIEGRRRYDLSFGGFASEGEASGALVALVPELDGAPEFVATADVVSMKSE